MFEAPEKAAAMLVHELLPHCSIEDRLVLLGSLAKRNRSKSLWSLPRLNRSRPPVTTTAWMPDSV